MLHAATSTLPFCSGSCDAIGAVVSSEQSSAGVAAQPSPRMAAAGGAPMGSLPREEENPEVGAVGWGWRSGRGGCGSAGCRAGRCMVEMCSGGEMG